jgi:hypothetical protein
LSRAMSRPSMDSESHSEFRELLGLARHDLAAAESELAECRRRAATAHEKVVRLREVEARLLEVLGEGPPIPRKLSTRVKPLSTRALIRSSFVHAIRGVLRRAGRPMRTCEIVTELEIVGDILSGPRWKDLTATSNFLNNRPQLFRRIGRGLWTLREADPEAES